MGKFRNILKRNRGFLVLCVLAGGASFATADMAMSDMLPEVELPFLAAKETESETEIAETAPETEVETESILMPDETAGEIKETYETDPFTITASGSVINGVEGEQAETAEAPEPQSESTAEESVPETQAESTPEETSPGTQGETTQEVQPQKTEEERAPESSQSETASESAAETQTADSAEDHPEPAEEAPSETAAPETPAQPESEELIIEGTPNDVVLWGISSRYIDESELYVMDEQALRLMRNEICALHGRIFTSPDLVEFFSKRSWYEPTVDPDYFDANMDSILNEYERANMETIYAYEQALKYGDQWWEE